MVSFCIELIEKINGLWVMLMICLFCFCFFVDWEWESDEVCGYVSFIFYFKKCYFVIIFLLMLIIWNSYVFV